MADNTPIEWTDATWNPITGCSVVSPGCKNCYAMRLAGTRLQHHPSREGLTRPSKAGPVWTGEVRLNREWTLDPIRWRRPRRIFVNAHGDTFHEKVPDPWIDALFFVMSQAPQHTFQILTKRADRMRRYCQLLANETDRDTSMRMAIAANHLGRVSTKHDFLWPLPNVWLGVSAEDQERANERIPELLETPAAVRWVSAEPLLGPIDLYHAGAIIHHIGGHVRGSDEIVDDWDEPKIEWVVVGGESGPGARPMHPNWARSIREQCSEAGIPFHFKQWGNWKPLKADRPVGDQEADGTWPTDSGDFIRMDAQGRRTGDGWPMQRVDKKHAGRTLDGRLHDEYPA